MDLSIEVYILRFNHRTITKNLAKLKSLVQTIFRTPVGNAKDLKSITVIH